MTGSASETAYEDAIAAIQAAGLSSEQICIVAEPWLDRLVSDWPADHGVPRIILTAARQIARYDVIARLAERLGDALWALPIERQLVSLMGNVRFLNAIPAGSELLRRMPTADAASAWRNILSSSSEAQLLLALDDLSRLDLAHRDAVSRLVATAALSVERRWSAASRQAQRLLVRSTPIWGSARLATVWNAFGLPDITQSSLLNHVDRHAAGSIADTLWQDALRRFETAPDITTAQIVWDLASSQSRLASLIGGVPLTSDARTAVATRIAAPAPQSPGEAWVYMTWREGADRLLGLISSYLDTNTRMVVSVGGDGRPPDLARASAILLADRTYMIARPVVTWGGPKLFFHNLLPVLEAFRQRASSESWFAVVCDRSFPLHGLARFGERINDAALMSRSGVLQAPQSWHREWDKDTVDNLPLLVEEALGELFGEGTAGRLEKLVGPESDYYPRNDFRLNQCHVNFATTASTMTGNARLNAQRYLISPLDVDLRWLSLGRLTEFVDVGSEDGATYARRLHPWAMQAVHDVLRPCDLRLGDPFFVASHRYARRLFEEPTRFALFSAMQSSLGPEMSFFDTFAWTHELLEDFHHLFARQPVEEVGAACLEPVLEDADASGNQFVRKVVCDPYDALLNTLARRLIDDSGWRDFHWVAYGQSRSPAPPDPMPTLDRSLVDRLVGLPLVVRDLLGRRRRPATFDALGKLVDPAGAIGDWCYQDDAIVVDFADPALGRKIYRTVGCSAERLTLVPDEIVDVYNGWSAFLDFMLDDLPDRDIEIVSLQPDALLLGRSSLWIGGPKRDSNLLAAFTDLERSTPTPTFRKEGCAIEIRACDDRTLVLATISGQPALLRLRGAAQAGDGSVAMLSVASAEDLRAWSSGQPTTVSYGLHARDLPGRWCLETFESDRIVELRPGGGVYDEDGTRLGRWLVREGGVQLLGLDQLRIALATQYRLWDGSWRLTGWARCDMQSMQSFALRQLSH